MRATFLRVFTLEVDGRAIFSFEAQNTGEARQICKESWLRDDLISLKSNGIPLAKVDSKLSVRFATPEEITVFEQVAPEPSDKMVLAYLVQLDPPKVKR